MAPRLLEMVTQRKTKPVAGGDLWAIVGNFLQKDSHPWSTLRGYLACAGVENLAGFQDFLTACTQWHALPSEAGLWFQMGPNLHVKRESGTLAV